MALLLPTKQMCLIDATSMTPRLLMRSMLAATLMFVAAGTSATAQMTAPSTAGAKPKPVTTVPIRPALQTPADTANAMAQAERLALQSDLAWGGGYKGGHTGRGGERPGPRHKDFPEGARRQTDRRAQSAGAQRARGDRAAAAGKCRLEDRYRSRHRRPAGRAHKTGAAAIERRQRRQMELADRHDPDPRS